MLGKKAPLCAGMGLQEQLQLLQDKGQAHSVLFLTPGEEGQAGPGMEGGVGAPAGPAPTLGYCLRVQKATLTPSPGLALSPEHPVALPPGLVRC